MVSRSRLPLVYGLLITSGFLGAWLTGVFDGEEVPAEISRLDLLLGVLGFFLFLGSILLFFYLVGRNRRGMDEVEVAAWKQVREKGKAGYIRVALIRGFLLGLVSGSLSVLYAGSSTGFSRLSFFIIVASTITFASYYAAIRFWKSNEEDYETVMHTDGQHNKRLQPTPR